MFECVALAWVSCRIAAEALALTVSETTVNLIYAILLSTALHLLAARTRAADHL